MQNAAILMEANHIKMYVNNIYSWLDKPSMPLMPKLHVHLFIYCLLKAENLKIL